MVGVLAIARGEFALLGSVHEDVSATGIDAGAVFARGADNAGRAVDSDTATDEVTGLDVGGSEFGCDSTEEVGPTGVSAVAVVQGGTDDVVDARDVDAGTEGVAASGVATGDRTGDLTPSATNALEEEGLVLAFSTDQQQVAGERDGATEVAACCDNTWNEAHDLTPGQAVLLEDIHSTRVEHAVNIGELRTDGDVVTIDGNGTAKEVVGVGITGTEFLLEEAGVGGTEGITRDYL